jgi:hypothetical protein
MAEHERCEQCGFDGQAYTDDALLTALGELGPRWRALLATAGDHLRTRPAPPVWSALEYAAHSRDVTAVHGMGVEYALSVDEPHVDEIPESAMAEAATTYADADPATVLVTTT